jgi:hypothetical protein
MFGLFTTRCPIDLREKTWVELRMQWLIDRFGFERLRKVEIVTPSDAHFPEAYSGTDDDVERILEQVCRRMGVRRDAIEFQLFAGVRPSAYLYDLRATPLGVFEVRTDDMERHRVWIERSQVIDPLHLVSTAAHELAHSVLLGDRLLTGDEADHEFVTDLLTVVLGFGIFRANTALARENQDLGAWSSWQVIWKTGYLPSRMYGYALAVFAWLRDEPDPDWAQYLRSDARNVFHAGLKYLRKSNDCLCRSNAAARGAFPKSLTGRLTSENAGLRLAALWELRWPEAVCSRTDEWEAVVTCLDDYDLIVVSEAALTIAALDRPDVEVARRCVRLLEQHIDRSELQSSVALALGTQSGALATEPGLRAEVTSELLKLLDNSSSSVVAAALRSLSRLRPPLDQIGFRQVWQAFRRGLVDCDEMLLAAAVSAVRALCDQPEQSAANLFRDEPELRRHARDVLATDFDDRVLESTRLPTRDSQPVPLPGWRAPPAPVAAEASETPDHEQNVP